MATTAIEVHPEVAVACYQKRVKDLTDVISSHSLRFRRLALRYLGNAADAEDAVQDALLSALTHVDKFKGRAKMSTWLTTIVIDSARMRLRRRLSRVQIALDEPRGEQNVSVTDMVLDIHPDSRGDVSQPRNCRKNRLCNLAALACFAHNVSTARPRGFQHSRNGRFLGSARGNGKGTARKSSREAQGSDQEELPGKRAAI
jgi:RNA polymerase sigma factor (sigma-70 family)